MSKEQVDLQKIDDTYFTPKGKILLNYYRHYREEQLKESLKKPTFLGRVIDIGRWVALAGLICGFGYEMSSGAYSELTARDLLSPVNLNLGAECKNDDGSPSDQKFLKLSSPDTPISEATLTILVQEENKQPSLGNVFWTEKGIYVEMIDNLGRQIGLMGPRPEGRLWVMFKPAHVSVYLGRKDEIDFSEVKPVAQLQLDSLEC